MQEYTILQQAEDYITAHFQKNVSAAYVFHSIHHIYDVVNASKALGKAAGLSDEEMEILQLAAWFHDAGYDKGPEEHEKRSCQYWRNSLSSKAIRRRKSGKSEPASWRQRCHNLPKI